MVYLSFKTTEVCDSTTVKMLTSIMLTYIGPKKSGDDNYFISRHFITYSSGNCEIVQQPVDEELTRVQMLAFQNGFAVAMMRTQPKTTFDTT